MIIPRVRVEDQGEYKCRAYNDKVSITGSVTLSIQSRPVFTISIGDMHVDEKDDLTWTCEAFGIPDVKYEWLKNGRKISTDPNDGSAECCNKAEDIDRYEIRDNVLIIRGYVFNSFIISISRKSQNKKYCFFKLILNQ